MFCVQVLAYQHMHGLRMPHFIYVGRHKDDDAKNDGNASNGIAMFDIPFLKGQPVEVTNPFIATKLAGNPYFRTAAPPADAAALVAEPNALLAESKISKPLASRPGRAARNTSEPSQPAAVCE